MVDFGSNNPQFDTRIMDASAEKVAFIIQAPKAGTLKSVGFNLGAVTFNAASRFKVSFQDVSLANGDPDGTVDQFRDLATLTASGWNESGIISSDGTDTGVKRSVTRGQVFAVVFSYQTFTAADSIAVRTLLATNTTAMANFPYNDLFLATWGKYSDGYPVMSLKYEDDSIEPIMGVWPVATLVSAAFNSGSTPDERGLIAQWLVPRRIAGFWWRGELLGDVTATLYDAAGATLTSLARDKDLASTSAARTHVGLFPTSIEVARNTPVRLALRPTTATSIVLYEHTVNALADMAALPGGANLHLTTRTDAGVWTETTTRRPWMGFIFDGADDGVQTGGGGKILRSSIIEAVAA